MSLQMRIPGDGEAKLYNPMGDVGHNTGPVLQEVLRRAAPGTWPDLDAVLDAALPHMAARKRQALMGQALETMARYVSTPPAPGDSMEGCLEAAGWFALEPAARVGVLATYGLVMLGVFHDRVREATLGGKGPVKDMGTLLESGAHCRRLFSTPAWLRPWYRLKVRLRRAVEAFRRGL